MRKILSTIVMAALLLLPLVSQAQNVTVTLSVSDNTKGAVTVPGPGTYTLDADEDSLVVTWTANSGYIIDGIERVWTSSGYVFVDTIPWIDHSITYVIGPHSPYNAGDSYVYTALLVPDSVTFTLAVNDPTMGTTNPVPGAYRYANGDTARFTAVPNAGYELQGWIIGQTSSWGTTSYDTFPSYGYNNYVEYVNVSFIGRMYSHDWTYTALFAPVSNTVTIGVQPDDPDHGTATITGNGTYTIGESVTVTATPNHNYTFSHWSTWLGQTLSYDNPYTFTAAEDEMLVAHFYYAELDSADVIISVNVPSLGTTNPAPGTYRMEEGDSFTVTAIPNAGNSFVRWTDEDGATISMENPHTFGIWSSNDIHLIANFVQGEYIPDSVTLTVAINNPSMGSTTPAPGTYTFPENQEVHFLATPYDGYFYIGWELQANYFGMNIRDTLFGENEFSTDFFDLVGVNGIVLTALFTDDSTYAPDRVFITIDVNDPTMGTTNPAPGTYSFTDEEQYTVTAIPNDGYQLLGWTMTYTYMGENFTEPLDEAITTITGIAYADPYMTNRTITAIFGPETISSDSLTIVVGVNNPDGGIVNPAPGTYTYGVGETITVTATAATGYRLTGWHVTMSHPVYGIIEDEVVAPMPVISFGVEDEMLGYVYSIIALFEGENGIDDADAVSINAYGKEGCIVLTGAEGREVRVYDISGRQLHHSRSAHATESYGVPATGIYLIKVAGVETKRVVVVR